MRSITTKWRIRGPIAAVAILLFLEEASAGQVESVPQTSKPRLAFFTYDAGFHIPGVRCTIPQPFWKIIATEHFISDVSDGTPQPDYAAMERANLEAVSAEASPLATFCQAGGDTFDSFGTLRSKYRDLPVIVVQPWASADPNKRPRPGQLAYFGLSELAWATIRNDRANIPALVRRTSDFKAWCQAGDMADLTRASDPLSIAVKAQNPAVVRSIIVRFRPAACDAQTFPELYERAFRDSLKHEDKTIASILLHAYRPLDLPRIAEWLNNQAETGLALEADSLIPPGTASLVVKAISQCDIDDFEYWLEKTARRANGKRAIDAGWQVLLQSDGLLCLPIFDRMVDRGYRLRPDSRLLVRVIISDRSKPYGEKISQADATKIVASFVRAGGRLDWNHNRPEQRPCQVRHAARLAEGGDCIDGRGSESGLTAFRSAIEEDFPEVLND